MRPTANYCERCHQFKILNAHKDGWFCVDCENEINHPELSTEEVFALFEDVE